MTSDEIRQALDAPLSLIVDMVKEARERVPPELAGDVRARGITLVGGGSLLPGLGERLQGATGLACRVATSPLTSIVEGAGRWMERSPPTPAPRVDATMVWRRVSGR